MLAWYVAAASLIAFHCPRLRVLLCCLSVSFTLSPFVQFERSIARQQQEKEFEKHITTLKDAFLSFKPFDQVTVAEVFAQHPEWEREFEEELKEHKWGETTD